jgi:hypothetical protein
MVIDNPPGSPTLASPSRACAVCGAPIPLGRGCTVRRDTVLMWFGCVSCQERWLGHERIGGACLDCLEPPGPETPPSEWACY